MFCSQPKRRRVHGSACRRIAETEEHNRYDRITYRTYGGSPYSTQWMSAPGTNHALPSSRFQVVAGGTGCSDYETDLSGIIETTPTGGWATFETQYS